MTLLSALSIEDKESQQQCRHPAFINNTRCASCNKTKKGCGNPTTIHLHYIEPQFSVTDEAITQLRDRNFNDLIKQKKLHLILDLDKTLIHASDVGENRPKKDDDIYDILYGMYLIKLRPGLSDFLKEASMMFDISICTMADQIYAEAVADKLKSNIMTTNNSFRFSRVICQEHFSKSDRKGLDIELSHEHVVLIVDDCEEVWGDEYKPNLITIKPYEFFNTKTSPLDQEQDNDQELARVLDVLKTVHNVFYDDKEEKNYASKDVRQLLAKIQHR